MPQGYQIVVLAEMVDAFDREQPKPGRETTAFIKRWRAKEMEEKHSSEHHLQMAIRDINPAEIQNIRETKKFRDGQRGMKKQGQSEGGRIGGRASAMPTGKRRAKSEAEARLVRNVIW